MEWNLLLLVLLSHGMSFSSAENTTNNESLPNSGNTHNSLLQTSLGEYCWGNICSKDQFCNELLVCQCCPGFKSFNDNCVPCKGEFEKCETTADCCGMLICINGLCRKPAPNAEFVTLAKICLAITATAIFVAIFSSLIKCLVRYGKFQSFHERTVSSDSHRPYVNTTNGFPLVSPIRPAFDLRQEKPPSYEECVRGTSRVEHSDPPPPYVVSVNVPGTEVLNNSNISNNNSTQSPAWTVTNQQTPGTTALSVQSLPQPINFNPSATQVLQSERNL